MNKKEYRKYLKTKKKIVNQILDIYEYKLGYDRKEIIFIYYELKQKSIKYLAYYYHNLIENM